MYYSVIGLLAALVLLIENRDILRGRRHEFQCAADFVRQLFFRKSSRNQKPLFRKGAPEPGVT